MTQRHTHSMYVFDHDYVADRVGTFLKEGLEDGAAGLVFATREHVRQLRLRVPDPRVKWYDAEDVLARVLVDGEPDAALFDRVVGAILREATKQAKVHVFGELVGLLCLRGRHDAALALEGMWNRLVREVGADLLCAYPRRVFLAPGDAETMRRIEDEHDVVEHRR